MTASRAFPLAVLGGLLAGLLFGAAVTESFGGFILCWMAPLPLYLVGLRLGPRAVSVAGLAGTMALAAFEPVLGIWFALLIALPVMALATVAVLAPRDRAAGMLVMALTGIGLAGFGVAYGVAADQEGGLHGISIAAVQDALPRWKEMIEGVAPGLSKIFDLPEEKVAQAGELLPGMVAAIWMLILAGNGILAEGALAGFGGGLASAPAMASITVPRAMSVGLGAALAVANFGAGEVAFIGASLAVIIGVSLLFGGLAVIHAALARHPARAVLLTVFYAVFFGPTISPMIVALGVIEQWVGLRRRLAAAPRQGEE
jgi:hypothetical protein